MNVSASMMSVFLFSLEYLLFPILNLNADLSRSMIRVFAMAESVSDTSSNAQKYHVARGASSEWESRGGPITQLCSR